MPFLRHLCLNLRMDNFVVSARKYRPAHFNTVVGQASITNTLKNAISNNHLAQAFLFCGPRGVGKTTCARILAKTINCTRLTPETEACDECESCVSFNSGQSFNVYELDAASNNSVDDIRNLVDQVRIPPQMGKYKVYIIDEVHMLSSAAFNAFLKTLEEPPSYAIFILATTERHKILPTILSRCQIFNFNRIQVEDIANHLAYIAKNENVNADPDALHIIAQKADGALRDACSIFDQVVSYAGNDLTYKAVIENLNVLDYDYYFKVTDFILANQVPGALLLFNEVLSNGFDGHNFVAGLAEHFRNLMVCKDPQTLQLLETGQNIKEKYKDQSARSEYLFLLKGLRILNQCDVAYKSARNPRLQVEFTLIQLCALNGTSESAEKKNDELEPSSQPMVQATISSAPTVTSATSVPVTSTSSPTTTVTALPTNGNGATKKPLLKSSGGLGQMLNPNAEKKTTNESVSVGNGPQHADPFTQEQLEQAWTAYADVLKSKGKVGDAAALTLEKPLLKATNMVEFVVYNKSAEERILADKTDLMTFLRAQLNNYIFTLDVTLTKEPSNVKLYTPQDKYKRLLELNPSIGKLKQTFDLDIEF